MRFDRVVKGKKADEGQQLMLGYLRERCVSLQNVFKYRRRAEQSVVGMKQGRWQRGGRETERDREEEDEEERMATMTEDEMATEGVCACVCVRVRVESRDLRLSGLCVCVCVYVCVCDTGQGGVASKQAS